MNNIYSVQDIIFSSNAHISIFNREKECSFEMHIYFYVLHSYVVGPSLTMEVFI